MRPPDRTGFWSAAWRRAPRVNNQRCRAGHVRESDPERANSASMFLGAFIVLRMDARPMIDPPEKSASPPRSSPPECADNHKPLPLAASTVLLSSSLIGPVLISPARFVSLKRQFVIRIVNLFLRTLTLNIEGCRLFQSSLDRLYSAAPKSR